MQKKKSKKTKKKKGGERKKKKEASVKTSFITTEDFRDLKEVTVSLYSSGGWVTVPCLGPPVHYENTQ